MTNDIEPFRLKDQTPEIEKLKGKRVALYMRSTTVFGRLDDLEDNGLLRLSEVPTKAYGKTGVESIKISETILLSEVTGYREVLPEEFESNDQYNSPLRQFIGKPVEARNGGTHYGIVSAVYDNDLYLLPSLVSAHKVTGHSQYRWEKETPTFVKGVSSISKLERTDLNALIRSSKAERKLNDRARSLHLAEIVKREALLKSNS